MAGFSRIPVTPVVHLTHCLDRDPGRRPPIIASSDPGHPSRGVGSEQNTGSRLLHRAGLEDRLRKRDERTVVSHVAELGVCGRLGVSAPAWGSGLYP